MDKRIMIIGSGGAGKSTLATQLGQILNRDVIHLDTLYWKPGWVKTPTAEWEALQKKLVQQEEWVIDGNYQSSLDIRLAAADTIIFLDFPKWLCLWRAIKRRLQYHNQTRHDLGNDNKERVTWQFIHWIFIYPRAEVLKKLAQYGSNKRVVILRYPSEVHAFLKSLVVV
jgi:adenylate kinase family enzyme